MNEFEGLITLGRAMRTTSARMGALIQLEDDIAYLVNEPKSLALKLKFKESLGTGTFYAGEAPSLAGTRERRDEKVMFQWKGRGSTRRVFVPNKNPVMGKIDAVFEKGFKKEGLIKIPVDAVEGLNKDILVMRLQVKDNQIHTTQRRSDGTVELNNSYSLSRGLAEVTCPDTEISTLFTADLYVFRGLMNDLYLNIRGPTEPVSVTSKLNFGASLSGVIAHLIYEV